MKYTEHIMFLWNSSFILKEAAAYKYREMEWVQIKITIFYWDW